MFFSFWLTHDPDKAVLKGEISAILCRKALKPVQFSALFGNSFDFILEVRYTRYRWVVKNVRWQTDRLTLIVLDARQLNLWTENLPALERELGVRYDADVLEDWFVAVIQKQRQAAVTDPDNTVWHSFWWIVHDGVAVGSADFKAPPHDGEVEIGYGLGRRHEGKGYMTEAVDGMCRWALSRPEVSRVIAETERDNCKSQRVLQRCGFTLFQEANTLWWERKR